MGIYEDLGVRRVINAMGYMTRLGGSYLAPEVVEAMVDAGKSYVLMDELQDAASKVIAETTGAEAGFVTAGAAAAIVVATAACMAGKELEKMRRLPNTEKMKNEVVILGAHHNVYDQSFVQAGAVLVEAGSATKCSIDEVESAISDKTALIAYICGFKELVTLKDFVALGKRKSIPVLVDAANGLPPFENLKRLPTSGADLVAFSGGKAIQGPNNSGILCGAKDLIQLARLNAFHHHAIGRPMKVSKEAIAGLLVALKRYASMDHEAERARWHSILSHIIDAVKDLDGVDADIVADEHIPKARLILDEEKIGVKAGTIAEILRAGEPSIYISTGRWFLPADRTLSINPFCINEGEEKIIAERIRRVLLQKGVDKHYQDYILDYAPDTYQSEYDT